MYHTILKAIHNRDQVISTAKVIGICQNDYLLRIIPYILKIIHIY